MSEQKPFNFEDMKKIDRKTLGSFVPLELFRSVRLIGMYQGLPMKGKNTSLTIGRKIGENFPIQSIEEVLKVFNDLKIGIPTIMEQKNNEIHIAVEECFCKGLPVKKGHKVCDLEGAILEGALSKVYDSQIKVKEVKCNINGDDFCQYQINIQ